MMPRKIIPRRAPSQPAQCQRLLDDLESGAIKWYCNAPMTLDIRQYDIVERCSMGHFQHAQFVIPEYDGDTPHFLGETW